MSFGTQIRILLCPNCGAPMETPVAGGQTHCRYCNAVGQLAARDDRPLFQPGVQPLSEDQRLARLRTQDGKPLVAPPALQGLLEGGGLAAWKVQEALSIWQSTRQELAATQNYEAAERLLFLTMMLANHFAGQNDELRRRAMFESALEAFTLPRHRQMMRGYLSRSAAKEGDITAAEQWLAPCDPRSDDLEMDSAWRMSRAYIETAKHDWNGVLRVLGGQAEQVPIMDAMDSACALLRANAWERLGQMQGAVAELQHELARRPTAGATLQAIIQANPTFQLCPQSFPVASQAFAVAAGHRAATAASGGIDKVFVPMGALFLLGGLGAGAFAAVSPFVDLGLGDLSGLALTAGILAITFIPMGAIFFIIGRVMRKSAARAERLRVHGIQGRGRVTGVNPTGVTINNRPQVRFDLQVTLPGRAPYPVAVKMLVSGQVPGPGSEVAVRVDPQNPTDVMIETN